MNHSTKNARNATATASARPDRCRRAAVEAVQGPAQQDRDDGQAQRRPHQAEGQQAGPPVDDGQRHRDRHQRQHDEQGPRPAQGQPEQAGATPLRPPPPSARARAAPRCRRTPPSAPRARWPPVLLRRVRLGLGLGLGQPADHPGHQRARGQAEDGGHRSGDRVEVGHSPVLDASASSAARRIAPTGTSNRPGHRHHLVDRLGDEQVEPAQDRVTGPLAPPGASGVGQGS